MNCGNSFGPRMYKGLLLVCMLLGLSAVVSPAQAQTSLTYISGNNQAALPSSPLPADFVVRNDSGGNRFIFWSLASDGSGGATFTTGTSSALRSLNAGVSGTERLTLGPSNGTVTVNICLGVFSGSTFSCTSNTVQLTALARTYSLTQVAPAADPFSGSPGMGVTATSRILLNGAVPPMNQTISGNGINWTILSDSTGGARIDGGTAAVFKTFDTSGLTSVNVTLGPTAGGQVVVEARASPFIIPGPQDAQSADLPVAETFTFRAVTPTVSVPTASGVTGTAANLSGTVNPNGLVTVYRFEYRLTGATAFLRTPDQSVGSGSSAVPVSASIALSCGSSYEVRGSATANGSTYSSALANFSAAPCLPVIGALSASNVMTQSARLNAQVNPNNASTVVNFSYRSGSSGAFTTAGSSSLTGGSGLLTASFDLLGLSCNTAYQFQVTAQNAGGTSGPSAPASFTTAACPLQAPTVSLVNTGMQQGGAVVTLTASASGGAGGYSYAWDLDGDNVIDRTGTQNKLDVTYPSSYLGNAAVTVTDQAGAATRRSVPLNIQTSRLTVAQTTGAVQLCGDGDADPEPGERWTVPLRISNAGSVAATDAYASFAAQDRLLANPSGEPIAGKLIVETPAISVGNLAAGASVDRELTVQLAPDASCGSSYGVLFNAGVDGASSSAGVPTALVNFVLPAAASCQVSTACTAPAAKAKALPIAPREGFFFNPTRGGNGLSVHLIPQGSSPPIYFGLWFTGSADHTPTWYAIQAPQVGNAIVAPIYRFTQVIGAPTFTVQRTTVGSAVIAMLGSQRMLFNWQIGTKSGTELMDYYIGGPAPSPNRTGAWYNPAESGSGQEIHQYVQNGQQRTFAMQFIYDGAGEPRWTFGDDSTSQFASSTAESTFRVHCPGCPWIADWNSFPIGSGTGTVTYDNALNGHYSSSIALPAPFNGSWTRSNLPIQILTAPQN